MADTIYAKNPYADQPSGIGPFAPAPAGVASKGAMNNMANYEMMLKIQKANREKAAREAAIAALKLKKKAEVPSGNGGSVDAPIASIVEALKQPDKQHLDMRREPIPAAPIPRMDTVEVVEPTPEQTTQPSQEAPATPELPPEQKATLAAAMSQEAFNKIAPTPEEKAKLADEMQKPTEDGMSIGQKMAAIAMAVAPTIVGYSLHGTKGAYLGAAATGKGLEAGATEMDRQTRLDNETRKADAAMRRAEKVAIKQEKEQKVAEKKAAFDRLVTDQYGNRWFYDENNNLQPVMVNGKQLREANTPISSFNAQTGQQETRMKFEQPPGTPKVQEMPRNVREEINNLIIQARDKDVKLPGVPVPYEYEEFIRQNPSGTSNDMTPTMRQRYLKWLDGQYKYIWDQINANEAEKRKIEAEKRKPKIPGADRAGDTRYAQAIKDNIIEPHYKPLITLESQSALYLDQMNKNLRNVTDGMKWQTYLKTIQQDASVIRPGESEMAMMFMPVKQKLDSWVNRNVQLDSWMTDQLSKDINNMFLAMKEIKTRNMIIATNDEAKNAAVIGKTPVFDQRLPNQVKTIAQDWARTKLNSGVGQIKSVQDAQTLLTQGKFRNGDMFMYQGKPFIVRGIKYGDEASGFKRLNNGVIEPWRLGR